MNLKLQLPRCLRAVSLAALLISSASASRATVLFSETWSGLEAGDSAVDSGRWSVVAGAAAQFSIVQNPTAWAPGLELTPLQGGTAGWSQSPAIATTSSFTFAGPLELSVNLGFPTGGSNYFRFTVENASNVNQSYFFDVYGTLVRLQKRTSSNTVTAYPDYTFTGSEFSLNALNTISMRITPLEAGGNTIEMLSGDDVLFSVTDTSGVPNLGSEVRIGMMLRNPRTGYVDSVTLTAVPEPGTVALLSGALLCVGVMGYRRHRAQLAARQS